MEVQCGGELEDTARLHSRKKKKQNIPIPKKKNPVFIEITFDELRPPVIRNFDYCLRILWCPHYPFRFRGNPVLIPQPVLLPPYKRSDCTLFVFCFHVEGAEGLGGLGSGCGKWRLLLAPLGSSLPSLCCPCSAADSRRL